MLCRSVKSVLNQTYKDFECIIVDDGSESEYAKILEMLTKKNSRIRVLHKPNGGTGSARNFGVRNASGEYVFFLDADDYISPFALENGFDIAARTGADMVAGGNVHTAPKKRIQFKNRVHKLITIESDNDKKRYVLHLTGSRSPKYNLTEGRTADSPCAKLTRRSIALAVPFEDKYWDEDTLWNIEMTAKCKKIVIADTLWYGYVIYPDSMVRGYNGDRTYEFQLRAKQEHEIMRRLWPECMQGVYYMIWDGVLRYCRTDTFQKNNPNSGRKKYLDFCNAIDFPEFREAMEKIDFGIEKRFVYRLIKKTIRQLFRLNDKRAVYCVLMICIRYIKY